MTIQKPFIPKGTRDFSPLEMVQRNYIFDAVREVFELYGYLPIETPAMENLSTLLGKYGEEGDKLLFKILNSGDFLEAIQTPDLKTRDYKEITPLIAEKGLRYDLTVPFARFVVQHQHEITFPFKRYQIQPVWRADRPQKGRYREFFQCDVDVIGSDSLMNEIELIQIIDDVFARLKTEVLISINNRKILAGIAEAIGQPDKINDLAIAIDKLEKSGLEKVLEELAVKGIPPDSLLKVKSLMQFEGKIKEKYAFLEEFLKTSPTGLKGVEEVRFMLNYLKDLGIRSKYHFDIKLARGLNYYTGAIIEVRSVHVAIGSLCGGGRYDDLTGIFGLPGVSGVGVSFGADRIQDVMNEMNLFPENLGSTTKVLFINFGPEEEKYCMPVLSAIRQSGVAAEIFPEPARLKKQMDYANKKRIPYVVLIGKDEMISGKMTVKNMRTGEQTAMKRDELNTLLPGSSKPAPGTRSKEI